MTSAVASRGLLPLVCALFLSCAQKKDFRYTNFIVGGPCEITFTCANGGIASQVVTEIDEELTRIDSLLNYFSPSSLVSALNNRHRVRADHDIIGLFMLCDSISRLTDGLFDISVAPLVEIWGFYDKTMRVPETTAIVRARSRVDFRKIVIKRDSLITPDDMAVDLSSVADGYAADRVGRIILKYGISSALINIAGEVLAIGVSPRGRPWKVGIKNPRGGGIIEVVALQDGALSTSGDYEKFFIAGNVRYSHIINPKSGYPATDIASATILARETAFADGISTAISIMGPAEGVEFIDSLKIRGIIYHEENGALRRVAAE